MIWRFLSDGGNKIQGIRFSQHNQTEHIACLCRILTLAEGDWDYQIKYAVLENCWVDADQRGC
jgi:hypothetical protein